MSGWVLSVVKSSVAISGIWVLYGLYWCWCDYYNTRIWSGSEEPRRRGYFQHLGLNLSVVNCSRGSVAITRIWVLFAVNAAWLFLAFGQALWSQG